jgi:hypothetical protein
VPTLELDMHPDPDRWARRLARLSHAMRGLRAATLYAPPSLPPPLLAAHLAQLSGALPGLQVRPAATATSAHAHARVPVPSRQRVHLPLSTVLVPTSVFCTPWLLSLMRLCSWPSVPAGAAPQAQ